MVLGLGLIATLHPNPRERSMHMDVLDPKGQGHLPGLQGIIQLAQGEMDLGLGQPSFEAGWLELYRRCQLSQCRRFVAHREVERSFGTEGLRTFHRAGGFHDTQLGRVDDSCKRGFHAWK